MSAVLQSPTCACGCGKLTALGRVAQLAEAGLSRSALASRMNVTPNYISQVLQKPPRYLKGHLRPDAAMRIAQRASLREVAAARLRDDARAWRRTTYNMWVMEPQVKKPWVIERDRQAASAAERAAHVADLRAFQLRSLQPFVIERVVSLGGLSNRVRVKLESLRRKVLERDQEELDHLRNLVGIGWRMDAGPHNPAVLYLDSFEGDERYRLESYLFEAEQRMANERERTREYEAAAAVMELPYLASMVRVALANPDTLTPDEREALRSHYEAARDGKPLRDPEQYRYVEKKPAGQGVVSVAALSPTGQGDLKRGPGRGKHGHHGAPTVGQKRFEGKRQIVEDRALREARREKQRVR